MPSAAAAKLEKQASTEAVDPIKQAIVIIEHKIRNLEKRKRKIESYREEQKNGKELNADQLNAVSKFDEVILTLDFARDLSKQFNGISLDAAKQQKKQARKEAQERTQQELAKIKEILLIQDVLQNIGTESAREDFLQGRNGAAQLTEEDLKYLDDIYVEVFPKRGNEEGLPPFADQVQTSAEHLLSIVDGKPKDVVGTTYSKLKELVQSIHGCGYFDQNVEEAAEEAVDEVASSAAGTAVPSPPVAAATASAAVVAVPIVAATVVAAVGSEELGEEEENFLVESQTVLPSEPQPYPQGPGAPVAPSQPGPPAGPPAGPQGVLAPVGNAPPQATQQLVQPPPMAPVQATPVQAVESSFFSTAAPAFVPAQPTLPQSRPLNEVIGTGNFNFLQDSELDSPDLSVMLSGTPGQTAAQHVVPTPPPSNPVAVPPIPSQTFTNQNFVAVSTAAVQPKPPGDMAHHIPGFATTTPNPPPPIPMPPSHQVPGVGQRPVAVHQMPPVSQPTPPTAALPQHRPPLTPAASYGAPTAAVPSHTYAAQAQQHPQVAQPPPPQQVPPHVAQQQPPPQQVPPPSQVQPQVVAQPQAPTTPVQPAPAQPVQAPPVPTQPVAAQPQSLPSAGFSALKPEPMPESVQTSEAPAAPGAEDTMDEWVNSSEVPQGGDWSTQTETGGGEWGQAVSNDDWNSGNSQNDGYTVQGGNRNYGGRGRGSRGGRGSSNGYSGRGRGNYQNGRGGSGGGGGGGGGYGYRNDDRSNNYYQNGYQRDNFSGGFKRGGRGGGGNPRGGMERGGGNSRGGMDRGGLRAGGGRGGNNPRGNRSGNFSRGGGNKQQ
ncbi:hypothetical protein R5R35_005658 [Gryllus longicercus]|uniref:Caprin-1 dimerization domain-containing protein n=1 Tax=Gryllus longicercus TaxID=2509291 RepID=A0AAN9VJT6_9ORTH